MPRGKVADISERVRSLDELTESREMMEARPHPFLLAFISLTVFLFLAAFAWSYFAKFEIVEKVNGVVRPVSNQSVVKNVVEGHVKALHYRNGQRVEKGQVLYEIDTSTAMKEYEELRHEISELERERSSLQRLAQSILKEENLFAGADGEAYNRFVGYKVELENSRVAASERYQSVVADVINLRGEIERLQNSLSEREKDLAAYKEIRAALNSSGETGAGSRGPKPGTGPDPANPAYSEYQSYLHQVEALQTEVDEAKAKFDIYASMDEAIRYSLIPRKEYETIQREYERAEANLAKYQADYMSQINRNMTEQQRAIQREKLQLNELRQSLREKEQALQLLSQYRILQPEQVKYSSYEAVLQELKETEEKLTGFKRELLMLQERMEKAVVKAPITGVVHFVNEKNPGDFIAAGEEMLRIGPVHGGEFEMQLFIPNHLIGEIQVGDRVRYSILAYDHRDYGHLEGEVTQLSYDAVQVTDRGAGKSSSYYIGWASINGDSLQNRQGQIGVLKPGMQSEVRVVVREERALTIFLRAINFIDS